MKQCENCLHTEVCGKKAEYIEAIGRVEKAKPDKLPEFVKIKVECKNYKGNLPTHPVKPFAQQFAQLQSAQNQQYFRRW